MSGEKPYGSRRRFCLRKAFWSSPVMHLENISPSKSRFVEKVRVGFQLHNS
ncbi:unnamed protein product [Brassica oleracea]